MQQPNPAIYSTPGPSTDAAHRANSFGRPRSAVRSSVTAALASGVVGCRDVLASHTGFPPESVRMALHNMLAAGQVDVVARAKHTRTRGRPRAVYALVPVAGGAGSSQASPLSWALAHVRTAWR
jgi:predicted ArsR family transcriptional regulator